MGVAKQNARYVLHEQRSRGRSVHWLGSTLLAASTKLRVSVVVLGGERVPE